MKIEKMSDTQIRCTLTREDLASRQIRLSELAYGTEKAKSLFRDMMRQASYEFGFEAEDIPLMIEAIPLSADTIILIITKVDYPEELDTRFSRFSPSGAEEDFADEIEDEILSSESADDILDLFHRITDDASDEEHFSSRDDFVPLKNSIEPEGMSTHEETRTQTPFESRNDHETPEVSVDLSRLFSFRDLDQVITLSRVLNTFYHGKNSLYKNDRDNRYLLYLSKSEHSPESFNKVCNILSEYAHQEKCSVGTIAFMQEHLVPIVTEHAIADLAQL